MGLFASVLVAAASAANLVVNPDFDQRTSDGRVLGWESLPSCFTVAPNAGENGSAGLVWENRDPKVQQFAVQKLALEPGREYRLSMRVKTEGLKGGDGGASVRLFWYDSAGRFVKDTFVPGTSAEDGWKSVGCPSVRMPKDVASAAVAVYMNAGFTGRAAFDSVSVTRVRHRPVSGMWCDAYRDCRAKGRVTFAVGLDLEDAGIRPADVAPEFRIPAADAVDGRPRAPDAFDAGEARLTLDVGELPRGKSAIGFRMWSRKTGKLVPDAEAYMIFERPDAEPVRTVAIDAAGRTLVGGKRFFPLGMFMNAKTTPALVKTYTEGPFNCVMNYRHADRAALDLWHANGIRVIYPLQEAFTGTQLEFASDAGADRWFADRINRYKDHPAILAWYVNDERGLDYMPRLANHQRLARELDADHPTWSVLYQVPDVPRYLGTFDVMGSDPYPISNSEDLNQVWNWTVGTVRGCRRLFPVWQVPQAFDWGAYWPDKADRTRMPTRDEMACMGWTAIAGGANGLVWYSYSPLVKMDRKLPFAKAWADVKSAAEEIARQVPVLLLDDAPADAVTADRPEVRIRAWRKGGNLHVLVVNLERGERTVRLTAKDGRTRTVTLAPIRAGIFEL